MNWANDYGIVSNPDILSEAIIVEQILARDAQIRDLLFCHQKSSKIVHEPTQRATVEKVN